MINNLSLSDIIKFGGKGLYKLIKNDILVVSFEVTLSCVCNCHHCDLGGPKLEEKQMKPEEYAKWVKTLKPLFVQISGGEPLLRKDIIDIVKSVKQFGKLPYEILVSNGALLDEEKYLKLRKAGIDQFSISLDFPDKRHDDFRRYPGLYKHLEETVPKLAKYGFNDVILNTAITKANFREVIPLAKKAMEWGVLISYSAYTPLRTGNREYSFDSKEDVNALRKAMKELTQFKKQTNCIVNPKGVFTDIVKYYKQRTYMPNCKAGIRFVVVMPDGSLVPCSMRRQKFSNLKDLREKFVKKNRCGGCYVSIRGMSERPLSKQIQEFPKYFIKIGNLLPQSKIKV